MIERREKDIARLLRPVGRSRVVTEGVENDEIAVVATDFDAVVVFDISDRCRVAFNRFSSHLAFGAIAALVTEPLAILSEVTAFAAILVSSQDVRASPHLSFRTLKPHTGLMKRTAMWRFGEATSKTHFMGRGSVGRTLHIRPSQQWTKNRVSAAPYHTFP